MASALIIVDVQNDFISGSLAVPGGDQVAQQLRRMLLSGNPKYDYVVTTQDWHVSPGNHWAKEPDMVDTWPEHCRAGTFGAQLHVSLDQFPFDAAFHKGHYNAAYSGFEGHLVEDGKSTAASQGLASWLREHDVTEVAIVGLAEDYCVAATAADANAQGFKTTVLLPWTAAIDQEAADQKMASLQKAGVSVLA